MGRMGRQRMGRQRTRGFTLIELMIVLTIAGVLAVIAAPSMTEMIAGVRLRSAASDMLASMLYARSEAVKRGSSATIVPNGGDYATGWNVLVGTTVLKTVQAPTGVDAISAGTITYGGNGRLTGTAAFDLQIKNSTYPKVQMRCVKADLSGKPYVALDTNGNASDGCN